MLTVLNKREVLYAFPITAMVLDWVSAVIATIFLNDGQFVEANPVAMFLGFEGAILCAMGIVAIMSVILFRLGISFAEKRSRWIFISDWLAIALAIGGFMAYLNNFGFVPILVHTANDLFLLSQLTCFFALVTSFFINRVVLHVYSG
ncbi:MAG: hypothetical protein HOC20_10625 [Chloroflexi bacterium]|jgi:hypothetical protein|nr:hypothetical protein [Chloroflexota bacterium]